MDRLSAADSVKVFKTIGIFCCYCVCFCKENSDSPFVKTGFKNWKKASGVKENALEKHMLSAEHQMAEARALNWLKSL